MTQFQLHCLSIENSETANAICNALEKNETLQQLDLVCINGIGHDVVQPILKSLALSKLQRFSMTRFWKMPVFPAICLAAEQALEKNMNLVHLDVWGGSGDLPKEVQHNGLFLALNATGQRTLLLENPDYNHETWVDALIQVDSVAALYYFLAENPALITQLVVQQPSLTEQPSKRKRLYYCPAKYSEEMNKRFK
ncbi:expressed unknown protein [Seminavis robusta]|uniref:Uncharacterized protein n=1 Tax=Seminavis robusta TaxID=568900 RepID=A0A9N8DTJ7_9STRA|nr:expressed unknown protein [Seminavis robusta]|eukprot:Sro346_g122740.1 n/a (195) ;mRNA; f:46322-46906